MGAIAGCHCWAAIAGLPLLGAIGGDGGAIGCTSWWIGCGDVAGCRCWVPLLGCHCWAPLLGATAIAGRHSWG